MKQTILLLSVLFIVGVGQAQVAPLVVVADPSTPDPESNGILLVNEVDATFQNAVITTRVGGENAGDPFLAFDVFNEGGWSIGIDNGDFNKLKFNPTSGSIDSDTKLTIDLDGRVGIGFSNPSAPLVVLADTSALSSDANGILLSNEFEESDQHATISTRVAGADAGDPFIAFDIFNVGGWSIGIDNDDADKLKFGRSSGSPADQTEMTIDENGYVGLSTTQPSQTLDVNGQARIRTIPNGSGDFLVVDVDGNIMKTGAPPPLQSSNEIKALLEDVRIKNLEIEKLIDNNNQLQSRLEKLEKVVNELSVSKKITKE